jgi:hypothetical protein
MDLRNYLIYIAIPLYIYVVYISLPEAQYPTSLPGTFLSLI